jgi:hypothetical protein
MSSHVEVGDAVPIPSHSMSCSLTCFAVESVSNALVFDVVLPEHHSVHFNTYTC